MEISEQIQEGVAIERLLLTNGSTLIGFVQEDLRDSLFILSPFLQENSSTLKIYSDTGVASIQKTSIQARLLPTKREELLYINRACHKFCNVFKTYLTEEDYVLLKRRRVQIGA